MRNDLVFSIFMLHLGQLNFDFLGRHQHAKPKALQIIVTTKYAADTAFLGAANLLHGVLYCE